VALVLDAGALIGVERADRRVIAILLRARVRKRQLIVPSSVLAQVWREGAKQARLSRFFASAGVKCDPLDELRARKAGQLCGVTKTRDIVDASVVVSAREHHAAVVTSDPKDLRSLDASLKLIVV